MNEVKRFVKKYAPKSMLRQLALAYHFGEAVIANIRFGFPGRSARVIMVTGTNGKTTTSAYIAKILQTAGFKVGVVSTAFYQIGDKVIPNEDNMTVVNVFMLQAMLAEMRAAKVDFIVLEVTAHALTQYRVWGIPPEVVVMTNLTQDHLDYYGTMDAYAAAKAKLFTMEPRFIVLNRDDEWFDYYNKYYAKEVKMNYGTAEDAECRVVDAKLQKNGSEVSLEIDKTIKLQYRTHLPGKFNVYNATAAATATYLLHVELPKIAKGIEALESVPGRLEVVDEGQSFSVVVDYAHTPDALQNLLETLKALTKNRLILVFGATGDRDKAKRPIMGEIAAKMADRVVLTDDESYSEDPAVIRAEVRKGVEASGGDGHLDEVADRREAIKKAFVIARPGDTVAITGMGHEKFRIMGNQKLPWNDTEVARELLKEKLKKP